MPLCKCGCGEFTKLPESDYCVGHWTRTDEGYSVMRSLGYEVMVVWSDGVHWGNAELVYKIKQFSVLEGGK